MCKFIYFFHTPNELGDIDIVVSYLSSHWDTEKKLKLNNKVWYEGHYTPSGDIYLRFPDDNKKPENYNEHFRNRFPTFVSFFNWCIVETKQTEKFCGSLDVGGCDLKGIKLPTSICGSLYVRGCDLKGIKLPENVEVIK